MILYIFNNFFPDDMGFSLRCRNEIDVISKSEDMIIFCRKKNNKDIKDYKSPYRKIKIERFLTNYLLIEKPKKYIQFYYEISRNLKLCFSIFFKLNSIVIREKRKNGNNLKIYVITSPLTIPLICYVVAKIHRARLDILEFHDLEPELAIHIKKLKKNSPIIKIEYFLEKFLARRYKKIIVTSNSQARRIINRTGINKDKVCVIPNTINSWNKRTSNEMYMKKYNLRKQNLIMGYAGSFSFDFTTSGMIKILHLIPDLVTIVPNLKILLIGDGVGLPILKSEVKKLGIENQVIFTGRVKDVSNIIKILDIGIIPWEKDLMTETILPTKLFEYMNAGKAVLAPNFGEFKSMIEKNKIGLLYDSPKDFISKIIFINKHKRLIAELGNSAFKIYKNKYNLGDYSKKLTNFIYK